MIKPGLDPATTALLLIDLQNDVLHPKGAYGRAGYNDGAVSALPRRLAPIATGLRDRGGWVIATHFTILEGKGGAPIISDHLHQMRPFLARGDFQRGQWGHALVDELGPADLHVDKFAFSAFYMTPLEWMLRHIKVDTLLIAGLTTPISVLTSLRDALLRDFRGFVLEDGVAAFDQRQHRAALAEMSRMAPVRTCDFVHDMLRGPPVLKAAS